jgi:hypothetical protein
VRFKVDQKEEDKRRDEDLSTLTLYESNELSLTPSHGNARDATKRRKKKHSHRDSDSLQIVLSASALMSREC